MEPKDTMLQQVMRTHISACKASGQTVKAYCEQHQLKGHQYYYWQKKIQLQVPASNFIKISSGLLAASVILTFANGHQVNFTTLPPVDYLKQLTQ